MQWPWVNVDSCWGSSSRPWRVEVSGADEVVCQLLDENGRLCVGAFDIIRLKKKEGCQRDTWAGDIGDGGGVSRTGVLTLHRRCRSARRRPWSSSRVYGRVLGMLEMPVDQKLALQRELKKGRLVDGGGWQM